MEVPGISSASRNMPEFLAGGGEMGQRIRDYDWSTSPLGPVEFWPQSLRTCIRIMLTSRQPIWLGWGKQLIKLYNDPYRAIVGGKHPWALGQPASVVWKDIWRDIEHLLKQVMEEDQGTYVESQLLIMERNGYPEETYYTFSYTPIPGDDGTTAGMICANFDDTDRIISERQLRTLMQLGKNLTDAKTNNTIIAETITTLNENPHDFPFAFFYTISDNKALLADASIPVSATSMPGQINLNEGNELSELLTEALSTRKPQIYSDIKTKIGMMSKGAWEIAPDKAIILPIAQSSSKEAYGCLVVGLNPYRLPDEKYTSFFSLIADQVATSFSDAHLLEQERKRAEALAEIDKAKTTFFSNISHEFRTPLTLLLAPIEDVLNNPQTTAENRTRAEVAYRNALRMQKLVNTLLDFSRIEAGRMDGKFTRIDIGTFTEDLASTFRSAVEKAGMQLIINKGSIQDDVYVDIDMWEKIILNLISNAFKYSKKGTISIDIKQQENEVHVTVADSGIGIPADQLDKIFNRFHRVENTEGRSQEGTGIGLAMVKELVKLHYGTISVSSEMSKGSVFTVIIPAGKAHLQADKIIEDVTNGFAGAHSVAFVQEAMKWVPAEKNHSATTNGLSPGGAEEESNSHIKNKILLADDNADMREYMQRLLSDQFRVITAVDGYDAYDKMVLHKPELLLTDIMMPRLDGFGLLKKVRSHPELRNIPVIFLSARAGEESKVEGLDAGADDYLVKPFSARELIVRVTNHIRINQVRRETELQFYQLFLQSPAIINVMKGPEHRFEFFHPNNKDIFGNVDHTGITVREALPELEGQGIFEMLDEVYQQGKTITQNERPVTFVRADGTLTQRYINFTYQPWHDLKGQIQGVLNFAIDVTETVESRKKIEDSEKQFKTVLVQSPSIFVILKGPDMVISFVNEPLLQSWGRGMEIVGKPLTEALPELKGQAFPKLLDKVYTTGDPQYGSEEKAIVIKNGIPTEVYYNYVYQPILDQDHNISGITVMASDITAQVIARKAIEESENRFRTLAETLPQLVWMTDARGEQQYASSRWKEYTGIEPETGKWPLVVHPEDMAVIADSWNTVLQSGGIYRIEVRLKNKQGEYRWFYGQGEPIRNESGEIVKWIGSFTDIQDQKEIEKKLEKLVAERTLELHRSNEDLQQFAHVASHDLKEPIRKIKTFSTRLQTEYSNSLPENGKMFIAKIQGATDRMYAMIEGVLKYSTLNEGRLPIEQLDLNAIIENIENDFELIVQQKNAVIKKDKLPAIEGASVLIYQLFYNLINNSLKFSRPDVAPVISITSSVELEGNIENARIVITDNGIGFDQEHAERIFDTFTRLNSKDQYEGTGLGLALCKKIVERHQGNIFATGEMDKGATFIMVMPIIQSNKQV